MIDNLPLSFFLPLVVHSLAGMATGITGIVTFSMPKRRERHPRWGKRYLWAYTILFLTATILAPLPLCSKTDGASQEDRPGKEGGNAMKRSKYRMTKINEKNDGGKMEADTCDHHSRHWKA